MSNISAKILLIIIGVMWLSLMLVTPFVMLGAFIADKATKTPAKKGWLYSVLLGQDHAVHTFLGGHYKTTISAQLGYMSDTSRTALAMATIVDWLFYVTTNEIGHCKNAMQKEDKFYFSIRRALLGVCAYFAGLLYLPLLVTVF